MIPTGRPDRRRKRARSFRSGSGRWPSARTRRRRSSAREPSRCKRCCGRSGSRHTDFRTYRNWPRRCERRCKRRRRPRILARTSSASPARRPAVRRARRPAARRRSCRRCRSTPMRPDRERRPDRASASSGRSRRRPRARSRAAQKTGAGSCGHIFPVTGDRVAPTGAPSCILRGHRCFLHAPQGRE